MIAAESQAYARGCHRMSFGFDDPDIREVPAHCPSAIPLRAPQLKRFVAAIHACRLSRDALQRVQ